MTTYTVQYFDHSGLLREAHAAGSSAADAMAKVTACEPRLLRIIRCLPGDRRGLVQLAHQPLIENSSQ